MRYERKLFDIKVAIKDREALKKISMEDLMIYLLKNEWVETDKVIRDGTEIGIVYTKYSKSLHKHFETMVIDETMPDYPARMAENLMYIEQCDGLSQLQIYCDITQQKFVIRPKK